MVLSDAVGFSVVTVGVAIIVAKVFGFSFVIFSVVTVMLSVVTVLFVCCYLLSNSQTYFLKLLRSCLLSLLSVFCLSCRGMSYCSLVWSSCFVES